MTLGAAELDEHLLPAALADQQGAAAQPQVGPLEGNDHLGRDPRGLLEHILLVGPQAVLDEHRAVQRHRLEERQDGVFRIAGVQARHGGEVEHTAGRGRAFDPAQAAKRAICALGVQPCPPAPSRRGSREPNWRARPYVCVKKSTILGKMWEFCRATASARPTANSP